MTAAIFLCISYAILYVVAWITALDRTGKLLLFGVAAVELVFAVIIYIICSREVGRAYRSVEKASEMMEEISVELEDGNIGILNTNFEKVVNMLREGRRKEAEEKKFLKDVMSDISHQLKTPIASLNVFIDLLLNDKLPSEEEKKRVLKEAENQMTRMQWMTLSMLKLARIEAGVIDFNIKEASVSAMLDEVRGALRYLTDMREQRMIIDCAEDILVKADPEWLIEALINIVKNASDYSDEGTDIEIRVEANSVFTRIYVKDHGIGIPESELPNIFKRFYRISNEVNPNSVGIGLALSKSIVEGMDGNLRVKSKVKDETSDESGTEFQIQLDTFNK